VVNLGPFDCVRRSQRPQPSQHQLPQVVPFERRQGRPNDLQVGSYMEAAGWNEAAREGGFATGAPGQATTEHRPYSETGLR
jgi:hypothetical protein